MTVSSSVARVLIKINRIQDDKSRVGRFGGCPVGVVRVLYAGVISLIVAFYGRKTNTYITQSSERAVKTYNDCLEAEREINDSEQMSVPGCGFQLN